MRQNISLNETGAFYGLKYIIIRHHAADVSVILERTFRRFEEEGGFILVKVVHFFFSDLSWNEVDGNVIAEVLSHMHYTMHSSFVGLPCFLNRRSP